ncbi:NAD-dependent epimerase/dehydratase family protein [uncultured Friedmanniella sp.]|uniref:NAD-dependent epimerase/dehydratase family protein n=1 Tax=uncultured Friedmanniella sp. TaxID=335381 RepID=UPI0035C9B063
MKILVTGGAGFIGSNLVRRALAQGWEVGVLDNLSTGYRANLDGLDVELFEGSLLDPDLLARACSGVEAVVHLAALGSVPRSIVDPVSSHLTNATGTLLVLEQARRSGVGQVIVSSSSSVYGMNPALPKSEREWVRPMSPYAVSKLAAEQYTLAYQQSFGLTTLAFRFFNVFGPYQRAGHVYAAVIPKFVDALLADEPLVVFGDGTSSRDFTYVGTVCEVLLAAVRGRVTSPEPVNLAFGTNTTLLNLIAALTEATGLTPEVSFQAPRSGDVPHSQADSTRLRTLFPDVSPVTLTEGLRHTLDWFRELTG